MSESRPQRDDDADPHGRQKALTAGPFPEKADATIILVHGRGASAESILPLYDELDIKTFSVIAPQAAEQTWYPHSFLAPIEANQPYLNSALRRIDSIMWDLSHRGIISERIALMGFSQGACLILEYVARHPRRYGAVIGLSGGLIGPPETPRNYLGSLTGVRVFLGASDPDEHVPFARVIETEAALSHMGAEVELRRYPGLPHSINQDEIDGCRDLLRGMMVSRNG
ncbi:MAG TPA: dienelactone hydrolase family protein [Tepidisphaeraceae bacterium]|nr:dienelactone hydrolase family protein [Tepidisphaeraceae bacterium]